MYKEYIKVKKPRYVFMISKELTEQVDKNAYATSFVMEEEAYKGLVRKFSEIQRIGGAGAIGEPWTIADSMSYYFLKSINWAISLVTYAVKSLWHKVKRQDQQLELPIE